MLPVALSHPRLRASSDHGALESVLCVVPLDVPHPVSGYFTTRMVTMTAISTRASVEITIVLFLAKAAGRASASGCALMGSAPPDLGLKPRPAQWRAWGGGLRRARGTRQGGQDERGEFGGARQLCPLKA
jgi:hypothetical protein